jgi:hypothetical protein
MDPITILSAAAAVSAVAGKSWELVSWIRELCQGVKTVDERVRRLKSGVTELARACESVHAVLQPDTSSAILTPPWDKDGSSAKSITRQVSDCRRTVRELKEILKDLRSDRSSRISRHMKLQDRGKQVDGLSARINIHTNALHMSLQVATIKIALVTPDFVIRELREALQGIKKLLGGTEDRNHRLLGRNSIKGDNEDPLIGLAQDALRRGTTLYEASVAGSTVDAESVMDSEKATSVDRWITETGDAAQNTHAPWSVQSRPASASGNTGTPAHPLVEDDISEASSSSETSSDDGSPSWEDSQCGSLPALEEKSAPTAKPPMLRRPPTDFSNPLNQWNRSDVVERFNIKPDGRFEVMICAGTKLGPEDLLCLKESEPSGNIDAGGKRERNKLALHFAVLFQDLHLIEPLVKIGYSPNFSAQVSDKEPLRGLRKPIDIAIASHCEPITKVLLEHGAKLNRGGSPSLKLFATASLNLWSSTDVNAYKGMIKLLLNHRDYGLLALPYDRTLRDSWTKSLFHQICDLPKTSSDLRLRLIIYALERYGRVSQKPGRYCSPLHVAIRLHDLKTLEFVLEASNAQLVKHYLQCENGDGKTPLRCAIAEFVANDLHWDIVEALLKRIVRLEETSKAPSTYLGGLFQTKNSLRTTALRSNRVDPKKLLAKY